MKKIPKEIQELLGHYVYLYIDPQTDEIFYVGMGEGDRAFTHLKDKAESKKTERIRQIRAAGTQPRIELLRHGLTKQQAALIESATIDAFGLSNLTNAIRGQHSRSFGRVSVKDLLLRKSARPAKITEPSVLITINRLFRSDLTDEELYEATRGIWKMSDKRANKARYAMAVYQGIVRQVYEIERWLPAGTLEYKTRELRPGTLQGRLEFDGVISKELGDKLRETSVRGLLGERNQNPIRYVNC